MGTKSQLSLADTDKRKTINDLDVGFDECRKKVNNQSKIYS